jgi:hypothetical protein
MGGEKAAARSADVRIDGLKSGCWLVLHCRGVRLLAAAREIAILKARAACISFEN